MGQLALTQLERVSTKSLKQGDLVQKGEIMTIRVLLANASLAAFFVSSPAAAEDVWHIKCLAPHGETLAVKAFETAGTTFDIKALKAESDDLLDIKALNHLSDETLHVKVLPNTTGDEFSDVKAISSDNEPMPIKAITGNGNTLHVKAFFDEAAGRYDIKCLGNDGTRLGLKAISPSGRVYDVKGLVEHEGAEDLEIEIEAHIKAIPQS